MSPREKYASDKGIRKINKQDKALDGAQHYSGDLLTYMTYSKQNRKV